MKCIVCGVELSGAGTRCSKCGTSKSLTESKTIFSWSANDKAKVKDLKNKYSIEAAKQWADFEKMRQENIRKEEQKRIQEENRRLEEQRKADLKLAEEKAAADRKAAEEKRKAEEQKRKQEQARLAEQRRIQEQREREEKERQERHKKNRRIMHIIIATFAIILWPIGCGLGMRYNYSSAVFYAIFTFVCAIVGVCGIDNADSIKENEEPMGWFQRILMSIVITAVLCGLLLLSLWKNGQL